MRPYRRHLRECLYLRSRRNLRGGSFVYNVASEEAQRLETFLDPMRNVPYAVIDKKDITDDCIVIIID